MLTGGNWLEILKLNIALYKHHDDIHDQAGIVQRVVNVVFLNIDKPGCMWRERSCI